MSLNDRFSLNRRQALGALGALVAPASMAADPYPSRPIKYVLPFSAGSSTDFVSRLVCETLSKQLGQPVVVENKPGAGGVIGTQQIARATPDGYTIGLASLATLAMAPPTLADQPYDSVRDFAPLTAMISTDLLLVAGPRAQGKSLAEFVAWARSSKEPLFLGTLGAGTSGHFAGFLFGQSAKIAFEPIHFRTFADLVPSLINGSVDVMMVAPTQMEGLMKDGKLRGLAQNGQTRLPAFAEIPTFKEAGYQDMAFQNWIGVIAPAKIPTDIAEKLSVELIKATTSPAVRTKLEQAGFRVIANTRDEYASLIRKDVVTWRDMVKNTGFKV